MNESDSIAVCSRSFSQNQNLRSELKKRYKFVKFNDEGLSLSGQQLIDFIKGNSKTIIGLEKMNKDILVSLPELKVISKYGVGTDNLDLKTMQQEKISLGIKPGVNKRSVSELVLGLTILMLRYLSQANNEVKKGGWNQFKGAQLTNKVFGIVGYGQIGKDLSTLIKPFDCQLLFHDMEELNDIDAEQVSLFELLKRSDIVSLHLPFNEDTKNIINKESFGYMKETSILINLSRGGIVNEKDLKEALISGSIQSAAFDVFAQEPPTDSELLNLPNFFATPHIGGISEEGIEAMGMAAIDGLDDNVIPSY